jgi:hypothetical protein
VSAERPEAVNLWLRAEPALTDRLLSPAELAACLAP